MSNESGLVFPQSFLASFQNVGKTKRKGAATILGIIIYLCNAGNMQVWMDCSLVSENADVLHPIRSGVR
jgi:hypothetical protein